MTHADPGTGCMEFEIRKGRFSFCRPPHTAVKDAGKAERKPVAQKRAMTGKEKKTSIHERLEINKKIIQGKQGQDKMERGADLGVRTV